MSDSPVKMLQKVAAIPPIISEKQDKLASFSSTWVEKLHRIVSINRRLIKKLKWRGHFKSVFRFATALSRTQAF